MSNDNKSFRLLKDGEKFDFYIIPKWIFREKNVGVNTLAILGHLIENGGTKDGCTDTAQKISHCLGCSLATVFVSLNKLKELGILEEESETFETYKRSRKISKSFHKYRKILNNVESNKILSRKTSPRLVPKSEEGINSSKNFEAISGETFLFKDYPSESDFSSNSIPELLKIFYGFVEKEQYDEALDIALDLTRMGYKSLKHYRNIAVLYKYIGDHSKFLEYLKYAAELGDGKSKKLLKKYGGTR